MNIVILIPAYQPGPQLISVVEELAAKGASHIVIVDNASGPDYADIFERCASFPAVRIWSHLTNRGKGASLKAGIRYILDAFPTCDGVVTADADGQHHPDDIVAVALTLERNPDCLIMGHREFGREVPFRSRLGNLCTRALVPVFLGWRLKDSQCGLRGLPVKLLPYLVNLPGNQYEFELDMLIAAKHLGLPVVEQPIQTIYEPGNPTSHFNPIRDSMKIYFVLFRFTLLALLTAGLDNLVFYFVYSALPSLIAAQAVSRSVAVLFNYGAARKAVFLSHESNKVLFPRYVLVVAASAAASYGLIGALTHFLGIDTIRAKITAESLLFPVNFLLLRDFVFKGRTQTGATDWTRYYSSQPFAARFTRKYTAGVLVEAFNSVRGDTAGGVLVELGGANSCFLDRIIAELRPSAYHVVDNNDHGLNLLSARSDKPPQVRLHYGDVLNMNLDLRADAVFSVGLIEHFDACGTRRAVLNHLELLRPGGCAIISFPTPTVLYRAARALTEWAGLWSFPDERPIRREEVLQSVAPFADLVFEKTLWPIVYTQHMLVLRKREARQPVAASA